MDEARDLTQIALAANQSEADVLQSVLASHGIDSAVRAEAVRLTHGFSLPGIARVRLLVRAEDADRARAALDDAQRLQDDPEVGQDLPGSDVESHDPERPEGQVDAPAAARRSPLARNSEFSSPEEHP